MYSPRVWKKKLGKQWAFWSPFSMAIKWTCVNVTCGTTAEHLYTLHKYKLHRIASFQSICIKLDVYWECAHTHNHTAYITILYVAREATTGRKKNKKSNIKFNKNESGQLCRRNTFGKVYIKIIKLFHMTTMVVVKTTTTTTRTFGNGNQLDITENAKRKTNTLIR